MDAQAKARYDKLDQDIENKPDEFPKVDVSLLNHEVYEEY